AAGRVLDDLTGGQDLANLVLADARPRAVMPSLTANLAALHTEIAELAPTYERANLPAAIGLAAEMLQQHEGPRQLVIISDLQASNWRDVLTSTTPRLPRGTEVTVVPTAGDAPGNVGV